MQEFNTLGERLAYIVEESGKTKSRFAVDCDVNASNFVKMTKGELGVSFATAKKIEAKYGFSAEWILKGKGDVMVKGWRPEEDRKNSFPYYKDLPVSAGSYDLATIPAEEVPSGYVTFPDLTDGQFAFRVTGCSMEPTIKAGEVIVVSEVSNWERVDPDKVYLIITVDDRMIKHLSVDSKDKSILWCISDNEHYTKFSIFKTEIKKIFRVTFHGSLL